MSQLSKFVIEKSFQVKNNRLHRQDCKGGGKVGSVNDYFAAPRYVPASFKVFCISSMLIKAGSYQTVFVSVEFLNPLLTSSTPFSPSRTASPTSYQLTKKTALGHAGFTEVENTLSKNTSVAISKSTDKISRPDSFLLFIFFISLQAC